MITRVFKNNMLYDIYNVDDSISISVKQDFMYKTMCFSLCHKLCLKDINITDIAYDRESKYLLL